jgi:hypothetical protein
MHRRDVDRCGGHFSGRGFGLPKYRAPSACPPRQRSRAGVVQPPAGTPDFGEDDFEALPTEWVRTPRSGEDDFEAAPDEGRNTVVVLLPASPDLGEVISRPPDEGVGTPRSREDDFEAAPDERRLTLTVEGRLRSRASTAASCGTISRPLPTRGAIPLSFYCPAERDAVVLLPASPDLGEVISGPARRSDQKGAPSEPQRLAQNRPQPRTFAGR